MIAARAGRGAQSRSRLERLSPRRRTVGLKSSRDRWTRIRWRPGGSDRAARGRPDELADEVLEEHDLEMVVADARIVGGGVDRAPRVEVRREDPQVDVGEDSAGEDPAVARPPEPRHLGPPHGPLVEPDGGRMCLADHAPPRRGHGRPPPGRMMRTGHRRRNRGMLVGAACRRDGLRVAAAAAATPRSRSLARGAVFDPPYTPGSSVGSVVGRRTGGAVCRPPWSVFR